jgi:hypothetical protein
MVYPGNAFSRKVRIDTFRTRGNPFIPARAGRGVILCPFCNRASRFPKAALHFSNFPPRTHFYETIFPLILAALVSAKPRRKFFRVHQEEASFENLLFMINYARTASRQQRQVIILRGINEMEGRIDGRKGLETVQF